jgi:hypothetical protein
MKWFYAVAAEHVYQDYYKISLVEGRVAKPADFVRTKRLPWSTEYYGERAEGANISQPVF